MELEKENEGGDGKRQACGLICMIVSVFVKRETFVWNSDERYPTLFFYLVSLGLEK